VTFVAIPDMTDPSAFNNLFKNERFHYVLHIASPIVREPKDIRKDVIDPGILGVKSLFQAAHRFGGSTLKRIVLTSSTGAMIDHYWPKEKARATRWNEDDWNPVRRLRS
jgi:NADPH-dependent methylglyoxal reductase